MKISTMLMGLVVVSMLVFTWSNYMVDTNEAYGLNYDNDTLGGYDKISELSSITNTTKNEVNNIKENPNVLDKLSSFVTSGYVAFKSVFASVEIVNDMSNEMTDVGIDRTYIDGLKIIFGIALFLGVAIAAILKWRT